MRNVQLICPLFITILNNFSALIEERGLSPVLNIHSSLGGWPLLVGDSWDEKSWTWQQSVKDFRKQGFSTDYIFDFSVGTDLKNSTKRIIDVRHFNFNKIIKKLI